MFWIGAAAGIAVAMLAVVVGISAIGWSVGKERTKAAEDKERLYAYWQDSIDLQREKNGHLECIVQMMEKKERINGRV